MEIRESVEDGTSGMNPNGQAESAMPPEAENYARIRQYLGNRGEEKPGYAIKLISRLDHKLPYVDILVRAYSQGYSVIMQFPVNSGKDENEPQILRLLVKINENMKFGMFNYDTDTGCVYFKYSAMELPSEELFNLSISLGLHMVEANSDEILAVMFGFKSADEAYADLRRQ